MSARRCGGIDSMCYTTHGALVSELGCEETRLGLAGLYNRDQRGPAASFHVRKISLNSDTLWHQEAIRL